MVSPEKVATYEVRACLPPNGTVCSDPLVIGTISKPGAQHYADVVGINLGQLPPAPGFSFPNGIVDQVDVDAYISGDTI